MPSQRQGQGHGADRRQRHRAEGREVPRLTIDRPDDRAAAMVPAVGDGAEHPVVGEIGVINLVAEQGREAGVDQTE